MGYRILLFDLDGTLLDFDANEADSLKKLFESKGHPFTDEIRQTYHSINSRLWTEYEEGKISQPEVLNTRFAETMARFGFSVDGAEWERSYREFLGNGAQLIDGALELCRLLSASHRLFAVTNGVTKTQLRRLELSGLSPFFEGVFTSQDIGIQKPEKAFFEHVMSHIEGFERREALMIGDSLTTDIAGGNRVGVDTCWVNLKGKKGAGIGCTYTVTSLEELIPLCG